MSILHKIKFVALGLPFAVVLGCGEGGSDASVGAAERTAPVGQVAVAEIGETSADAAETAVQPAEETPGGGLIADANAAEGVDGKAVYDKACVVCHGPGLAGAPKLGDAASWKPRIEQGMEVLYEHAINGFMGTAGTQMPAKGGQDISDEETKAAVDYMVENSK